VQDKVMKDRDLMSGKWAQDEISRTNRIAEKADKGDRYSEVAGYACRHPPHLGDSHSIDSVVIAVSVSRVADLVEGGAAGC
jgi:hypothetical protein